MKKILGMLGTLGLMVSPVAAATTVVSCGTSDIDIVDWSKVVKMSIEDLNKTYKELEKEKEKTKEATGEDITKMSDEEIIKTGELYYSVIIINAIKDAREAEGATNDTVKAAAEEIFNKLIEENESVKDVNLKAAKAIAAYLENSKKAL